MPRFPKRLLALGALAAGGVAAARRRKAAAAPPSPAPVPPPPADTTTPDPDVVRRRGRIDELVEAETAAAAAEARGIGGPPHHDAPDDDRDPALDPVYEAGGGEQEGFELAERDLVENATHGGGRGDPSRDAIDQDAEAQESTSSYGEADEEHKPDD